MIIKLQIQAGFHHQISLAQTYEIKTNQTNFWFSEPFEFQDCKKQIMDRYFTYFIEKKIKA